MSKHTPGPWEVHEAFHADGEFWCSIGHDGRGPITDIVGEEGNHAKHYTPVAGMKYLVTPVEQQKANARLIAASPDMLKELKANVAAFDAIDKVTPWSEDEPDWWLAWGAVVQKHRNLIGKIEGRE